MLKYIILFIGSGLISLSLTPLIRALASHKKIFDLPDGRKIHGKPIPRLGGLAIFIAFNLGVLIATQLEFFQLRMAFLKEIRYHWLLAGSILVTGLGAIDDIRSVPISLKFFFQIIAGLFVVFAFPKIQTIDLYFGTIHLGPWSILITLLWVVGITNAINLLDGLDGLAAGVSFIIAILLFILFLLKENIQFAIVSLIFAGSILGFLKYNFHPASIFLGDSGSYYLGFILSILSVMGGHKDATTVTIIVPILALGLPIIDTILSMLRRLLKSLHIMEVDPETNKIKVFFSDGWTIFKADRGHIHHHLLQIGFTHKNAVIFLYGVCIAFGLLSFFTVYFKDIHMGLMISVIVVGSYIGIRKLRYSEVQVLDKGMLLPLFDFPIFSRRFFRVFVDAFVILITYYLSFLLRFEGEFSKNLRDYFVSTLPVVLAIRIWVFYFCGLYKGVWRYTNIGDLIKIAKAVFLGCIASALGLRFLTNFGIKSWSALIIDFYLLLLIIMGVRSSYRFLEYLNKSKQKIGYKTLIYGAGRYGAYALREFIHNPSLGITPVGFIDDDGRNRGRLINGFPILADLNHLEEFLEENSISDIVVASNLSKAKLERLSEICKSKKINLRRFEVNVEKLSATASPT
jgi:UDP-GlcNAc:undecaprenyl-phosphate GlcNAc-1-phosphate transferase